MKGRKQNDNLGQDPLLSLTDINGRPMKPYTFSASLVEDVRRMANRLSRAGRVPERLAITSALRQEGVTTVSRLFATVLANDLAAQVCLVDLNWWWPAPSQEPEASNQGLAGVLAGTANLGEVMVATGLSNLALLPAGTLSEMRRHSMARSEELQRCIDDLSREFDYLVLDIPAILATSDAVPLASLAQDACLVVQQGATHFDDVQLALAEISHMNVAGVVLNRAIYKTPRSLMRLISSS